MTKVRKQRGRAKSPAVRSERRRTPTMVLACAATVTALALCGWLWHWYTAAAPPAVSLSEVDPALAEAIQAARREVWWNPHSASSWGRLGQLLRAHRYQPESNFCFAQAERIDPSDPRWPYLQGISRQLDDPEAAIRHLQRTVTLCGSVPDGPELRLAEVYLRQERWRDAEQHFRHILERDGDNARAHLGLGRLAYERGNLQDAVDHLKQCASSPWTRKASGILLAQVYHQLGDRAAADREQARSAALPKDPAWPDPFLQEVQSLRIGKQIRLARVKTLHQQHRAAEVRPVAAKLETDYPDIYWLVEGRLQGEKGNLAAAEQALRKAIQLAPDSVDAHFDLGKNLLEQKQYGPAAQSFQKVIELEPTYGPAYQGLAQCSIKKGNREEALRALQAAVEYMPQDAEAHRILGKLLVQQGRAVEAKVHLRQALQLQPDDITARELLDEISKPTP